MVNPLKKISIKLLSTILIIITVLFTFCESNDRYYRPDLPESLCCIGIIDDDTNNYKYSYVDLNDKRNNLRFIFEKSVQSEYQTDIEDSLRNFFFLISSKDESIYSYQNVQNLKNFFYFELPDDVNFISGQKYLLLARENSPEIYAESTVPETPPDITLISINKEVTVAEPLSCYHPFDSAYNGIFNISLINLKSKNPYYILLVYGKGTFYPFPNPIPYSGPTDFIIRETNTHGFYSELPGLKIRHHACFNDEQGSKISQVNAYIFDGSEINADKFLFTILVPFHNNYSPIVWLGSVRIKLLSIPRELYEYEKNLYTYLINKSDPFSEPVYLKENIINGNGIFAICRSTEITINLPFPPMF